MTELPTTSAPTCIESGFRSLMTRFPTGVAVVTTLDADGRPHGLTCSSVCSVTLRPPTMLVCLRDASPTLDVIRRRSAFAVNFLHDRSQWVAELFASGAPDRFDLVHWERGSTHEGPYLPRYAHAVAGCRTSRTEHVGDHVVVFGETVEIRDQQDWNPLLYGLREYRGWPESSDLLAPSH